MSDTSGGGGGAQMCDGLTTPGFLEETGCLDPFQSDVRLGYGTKTALLTLVDDLRRVIDRRGECVPADLPRSVDGF